jgi:hypothetical protein
MGGFIQAFFQHNQVKVPIFPAGGLKTDQL